MFDGAFAALFIGIAVILAMLPVVVLEYVTARREKSDEK